MPKQNSSASLTIIYADNESAAKFREEHGAAFESWARNNRQPVLYFRGSNGRFSVPVTMVLDRMEVLNGLHAEGESSRADPNLEARATIYGTNEQLRERGMHATAHWRKRGQSLWLPNVTEDHVQQAKKKKKQAIRKKKSRERKDQDGKDGGGGGGAGCLSASDPSVGHAGTKSRSYGH